MAVTSRAYGLAGQNLAEADFDWASNVKVMLVKSTYVPDHATHRYASSVDSHETTGTNYTAGGILLPTKTTTYATNVVTLDCADPVFSNLSATFRYAVFYFDSGVRTTSGLLCIWDLGADVVSSEAPFTLEIAATGLMTLTAS